MRKGAHVGHLSALEQAGMDEGWMGGGDGWMHEWMSENECNIGPRGFPREGACALKALCLLEM